MGARTSIKEQAAKITRKAVMDIDVARVERGISMRALSAAAGLRPTSYWGILQNPEGIKSTTLSALQLALRTL